MSARRLAKIAAGVRQVVSTAILFEMRDPRVVNVTVLGVDVAPDLRSAKVRVSVMGDDKQQRLALKGLDSARGFLQARIADELDLRYTPVLTIVLDDAVKKSIAVSAALRDMSAEQEELVDEDDSEEEGEELEADGGDDAAPSDQTDQTT